MQQRGQRPPGTAAVETLMAVRRARDVIDRHYAEPLDLVSIAESAGYSPYHLVRAFRAAYGETPGRYLTRRRVERARELLRSANLTVTEVCHLVGFSSLGSFSSLFTRLTGESPARFQRRVRASGAAPIPGCFVLMWSSHPGADRPNGTRRPSEPSPNSAIVEKPERVTAD